jgi:hypothetical protein
MKNKGVSGQVTNFSINPIKTKAYAESHLSYKWVIRVISGSSDLVFA